MPTFLFVSRRLLAFGLVLAMIPGLAAAASARLPPDLEGTWELAFARSGVDAREASCRILLRSRQSDKGDYFLGMPVACRHAMPFVATVGRWNMPDGDHVVFDDPSGAAVLRFAAAGEGFSASQAEGTYTMTLVARTGRSVVAVDVLDGQPMQGVAKPVQGFALVRPVSKHSKDLATERERPSDLAGRYAVMRDKRDTGCMITLDDGARVKGGDRAQLAPGCRDQGIVIFDPSAWTLVKGDLVLTARAGHKAVLERQGEGVWTKDPKDGGKPLGLKKL